MILSQKVEQLILTSYRKKIEKLQKLIENGNTNNMNWRTVCLTLTDIFKEHCALQSSLGNEYGTPLSNLIQSKEEISNALEQENGKKAKTMVQIIGNTKENREPVSVLRGAIATPLAKDSKNEEKEDKIGVMHMRCQIQIPPPRTVSKYP